MLSTYPELIAGVNYFECAGSPEINTEERGITGTRTFRVHGSVLGVFKRGMKGSARLHDSPEFLDTAESLPSIMCVAANAKPWRNTRGLRTKFTTLGVEVPISPAIYADDPAGPANNQLGAPLNKGLMQSEWWEVTCRFDALFGVQYDFAGEALSVPTGNIGWLDDDAPIGGQSIVTTVPASELQIVRRAQPLLGQTKINRTIGMTNAAVFNPFRIDMAWRASIGIVDTRPIYTPAQLEDADHAIGTVLFLAANATPVFDAANELTWDVTYKFALRPNYAPWNHFFRVERSIESSSPGGRWERLYVKTPDGDSTLQSYFVPYPPVDLGALFV